MKKSFFQSVKKISLVVLIFNQSLIIFANDSFIHDRSFKKIEEDCATLSAMKLEKLSQALSPALLYQEKHGKLDDAYQYGLRFSAQKLLVKTFELRELSLKCQKWQQEVQHQEKIFYWQKYLKLKALEKKQQILTKNVRLLEQMRKVSEQRFQSRVINLPQYLNQRKKIYQIMLSMRQVEKEVEELHQGNLPLHHDGPDSAPPSLPLQLSDLNSQQIYQTMMDLELSQIKNRQRMNFFNDWQMQIDVGKNKSVITDRREENYFSLQVVLPFEQIFRPWFLSKQNQAYEKELRSSLDHRPLKMKAEIEIITQEIKMQQENLKELQSFMTPPLISFFENKNKMNLNGEILSEQEQNLWLDNILIYAEFIYLQEYLKHFLTPRDHYQNG